METKISLEVLEKETDHAFGKDVYLLGRGKDGARLWLEAPQWDCGWYWSLGYVETYGIRSNNIQPRQARDIFSHQHLMGLIFRVRDGKDEGNGWLAHWNEYPDLAASTLTESESWEFSDLMKSAYTLKEVTGVFHQGNSHLTTSSRLDLKDAALRDRINKVKLPLIFAAVREILTPAKGS